MCSRRFAIARQCVKKNATTAAADRREGKTGGLNSRRRAIGTTRVRGIATRGGRAAKPADADKAAPEKKGTLSIRERSVRAGPVSRVLFPGRTPDLCHLSRAAVSCRLKQPTPRHRASNPSLPVYTVLQPARRTAGRHRCPRGGLLPRLFTLTRREIPCGRFFSVTLLYPHGYQVISLRGALRCPDFPLPATAGSDRADLHRKDNKIRRYSRFGGGRDIRKMRFPPPYGP